MLPCTTRAVRWSPHSLTESARPARTQSNGTAPPSAPVCTSPALSTTAPRVRRKWCCSSSRRVPGISRRSPVIRDDGRAFFHRCQWWGTVLPLPRGRPSLARAFARFRGSGDLHERAQGVVDRGRGREQFRHVGVQDYQVCPLEKRLRKFSAHAFRKIILMRRRASAAFPALRGLLHMYTSVSYTH